MERSGFGSRRNREQANEEETKKPNLQVVNENIEDKKEEIIENNSEEIQEAIKEIAKQNISKTENIVLEIDEKQQDKKAIDDFIEGKTKIGLGLTGNSIEAVDFRAIVKKQELKIGDVLTKLIKDYNDKNYKVL
jgi:hypothetical protein